MPNVRDVNLFRINRIEDQIAQTRDDKNAGIRLVGFSSLARIVCKLPRPLDQIRDNTRRAIRAVLTNIGLNLSEIAQRRSSKPNPHAPIEAR